MQDRSAFHFIDCTVVLNWYKGWGCFCAASSIPSLVLKLPLRGNANYRSHYNYVNSNYNREFSALVKL